MLQAAEQGREPSAKKHYRYFTTFLSVKMDQNIGAAVLKTQKFVVALVLA